MSYARWGCDGSDVYVFGTEWTHENGDPVPMLVCLHGDDNDFSCATAAEMVKHLLEHRERGQTVPQYTIERLLEENP